jgi:hypothetical protein
MAAPLTPPDCDLRGLPFMPLDVVRLGDSDLAALSTGDEFKAAVLLWCKAWAQVPAASLPDDDRVLAHLTGLGPKWKRVRSVALKGWVKCSDGRLYHPVVAEKALEAWKHRQSQRERANKRWHGSGSATGDATASDPAMQGTGTVKGEKEEKIMPAKAGDYAFFGKTIKLAPRHFNEWHRLFKTIPDLEAELSTIDDWWKEQPEDKRANWFLATKGMLNKRHQANLRERDDGYDPNVITV